MYGTQYIWLKISNNCHENSQPEEEKMSEDAKKNAKSKLDIKQQINRTLPNRRVDLNGTFWKKP